MRYEKPEVEENLCWKIEREQDCNGGSKIKQD